MLKRVLSVALSAIMVFALLPAAASAAEISESDGSTILIDEEGDTATIAVDGTMTIDFEALDNEEDALQNISIASDDAGKYLKYTMDDLGDYKTDVTGLAVGTAKLTVTFTPYFGDVYTSYFNVEVIEFDTKASASGYVAVQPEASCWATSSWYLGAYSEAEVKVKLDGLPADAVFSDIDDTNDFGYYTEVTAHGAGYITFFVAGPGTHNITVKTGYGVDIKVTITLSSIQFKAITTIKRTGSIVTKPKQKTTLTLKAGSSNVSKKAKWKSTKTKIATVSSTGVVKGKGKGNCYVKASYAGATIKIYVEVTSSKAYAAVQNAWKDYKSKIKYSQGKRNSKGYRDCSSFVSRCYYSNSPKRRVKKFGGTWPMTAADQAKWLNSHGKKVAKKAVRLSKARPGDTVYYGGSSNGRYRGIYHADLYVGNGYLMGTSGYRVDGKSHAKYCISYSWHSLSDPSIKFVGRLCP